MNRQILGTCVLCNKPVYEGEARYSVGEYSNPPKFRHWDCKIKDDEDRDQRLRRSGPVGVALANMLKRVKL